MRAYIAVAEDVLDEDSGPEVREHQAFMAKILGDIDEFDFEEWPDDDLDLEDRLERF